MTSNDGVKSDPGLVTRVGRIVEQVAGCDPSIQNVAVLDAVGHILSGWEKTAPVSMTDQLGPALVSKLGVVAKVVMGAMRNETGEWGRMDFLVAAFEKGKFVLTDLEDQNMTLIFEIPRSTMADSVYDKVVKILAATR